MRAPFKPIGGVWLATIALGIAASLPAVARDAGQLVIIGGGSRPAYLMERIVELAGGTECRITIIPMASSEPLETALYQRWQLEEAGCPNVNFVRFERPEADSAEVVAALNTSRGVFFSGGDQSRLLERMQGSRLLERVREIYEDGGVLAGTSAGAAIMSRMMITGDVAGDPDDPRFAWIRQGYVITRAGFGFVPGAIVDQHFVARGRHNRLLSLVLENPSLVGIGIDESTAAIFTTPTHFEVLGESQVVVYDATTASGIETEEDGDFAARDIRVHLLGNGQSYDLERREVRGSLEPVTGE